MDHCPAPLHSNRTRRTKVGSHITAADRTGQQEYRSQGKTVVVFDSFSECHKGLIECRTVLVSGPVSGPPVSRCKLEGNVSEFFG